MCSPTYALTALSVASSAMQYKQGKAQQQAQYAQQKRQNDLARKNAIQRYATEQLRIRQELKKSAQADYEGTIKSRRIRSEYISEAGDAGGLAISGSTAALLKDYYRTQANYKNSITNNMNLNISQFERNLEAIQFGQEAQSVYMQPPNSQLLFASSALNVANTYYSLEAQKEAKGLMTNAQKRKAKANARKYQGYS